MSSSSSASKKRANLCVPYVPLAVPASSDEISGLLASTLPMVAMFLRNKLIAWSAVLVSVQSWLNETESSRSDSQPGWIKLIMSLAGLVVCYMDLFFPAKAFGGALSGVIGGGDSSAVTTRLSMAPRATA
ncbi:uncharacterized protein V2V93DRAFT_374591 [Kockiozyma suomiensis]|uniref:uncharacterized protein n=1 Tax=Kockiozyma suomiensis TaxID=1337062 RepID=UPI00334403EC